MQPTIKPGDYTAVDENYYSKNPVRRFDIILFTLSPENYPPGQANMGKDLGYVKRVVGLGGETLEIRRGKIYISGQELEEPYAAVPLGASDNFGPIAIPEGEYFVLGDNRQDSMDSRFWARPTLKKEQIVGKIVEIFPR